MRALALVCVVLGCKQKAAGTLPEPAPVPLAGMSGAEPVFPVHPQVMQPRPNVNSLEGHGGIAIDNPEGRGFVPPAAPKAPIAEAPVIDPGDVKSDARDLYLRAYQLKGSDPAAAIRLAEQILREAPPQDPIRAKAAAMLKSLGP